MKKLLLFLLLVPTQVLFSQEIEVRFLPTLNGAAILPEQPVVWNNDTIFIENLRFYITHLSVGNESKTFPASQDALLIDIANPKTVSFSTESGFVPSRLSFLFGTDSLTNCSGILGGDLDPALGMYWAWQSGYINFKLEGKSSFFKEKEGEFTFHLGGYHAPFSSARSIVLPVEGKSIIVELPLDALFQNLSENMTQIIMRPCKKGSELATFVSEQFRISK